METVGTLVRQRRESLGFTLAVVAEQIGCTKGYLSMIENHRVGKPPSPQLLNRLEEALAFTGGELLRAADWQNTPNEVRAEVAALQARAEEGELLAKWLRDRAKGRADGAKDLDELFHSGELSRRIDGVLNGNANASVQAQRPIAYRVPLINKVAAGYPTDFTDLDYPARVADTYIPAPEVTDTLAFAATVVGESMQPDYREGDVIIFSPEAEVKSGDDCFVRLEPDHESTFKRVFFDEEGAIRLQPLNPSFPPTTLPREKVAGVYRAVARYQRL